MIMDIYRNTTKRAVLIGGGAGLFFSLFALVPIVYFSRPTFHLPSVVGMVMALSFGIGGLGGYLADVRKKGFRANIAYGITAAAVCIGALFGAGWDPGRTLDESSLRSEYHTRFPYGRPALARDEDVLLLEKLAIRYSRTRADMRAVKADLDWLKAKRRDDAQRIFDMQQTLERIETIKEKGLESRVTSRSRSRFRLPRHHKTPIIIW